MSKGTPMLTGAGTHRSPCGCSDFNPLRPWGQRPGDCFTMSTATSFQPTPPVWAETKYIRCLRRRRRISTHSARVGGDPPRRYSCGGRPCHFNPLRPWGRRRKALSGGEGGIYFNPLRPWGRRPGSSSAGLIVSIFQPTPPVGAETRSLKRLAVGVFQPTPPAGAETAAQEAPEKPKLVFQPTPPVWAETDRRVERLPDGRISTRSARVGGDVRGGVGAGVDTDFNPLRPCGRRPLSFVALSSAYIFQPAPPVWAETQAPFQPPQLYKNFNPLRPCGRRLFPLAVPVQKLLFQPTPLVGAETP